MKEDISSRYESHSSRRLAIDVSVGRIEELFENFDSAASYVKKDLDQDLVEYLIESVQEIRGYDFVIRINLPVHVQEKHRKRVRKSIKSYFWYLELLEQRKLRKMLWKSFLLFCLGMILLMLKVNIEYLSEVMQELLTEGLTVAAWVLLWSAFGGLIFELAGIIGNIRIYRRIASREVVFKCPSLSKALHADEFREDRAVGAGTPHHGDDQKMAVII